LAYGGATLGSVRHTIDHEAAHATDALAAIVVEGDRLFAFGDQTFVEHVEHLEKRHLGIDIGNVVARHTAFFAGLTLSTDVEGERDLLVAPLAGVDVVEVQRFFGDSGPLSIALKLPGGGIGKR